MTETKNLRKENELDLPIWSVISFEKTEASNLTYAQATQELAKLNRNGVSGLCIITDAAAEKTSR